MADILCHKKSFVVLLIFLCLWGIYKGLNKIYRMENIEQNIGEQEITTNWVFIKLLESW